MLLFWFLTSCLLCAEYGLIYVPNLASGKNRRFAYLLRKDPDCWRRYATSGAGGGTHRFRVYRGASEMNTDLVELRSEDSLTDLDERTTCYFLGCMHWLLQE